MGEKLRSTDRSRPRAFVLTMSFTASCYPRWRRGGVKRGTIARTAAPAACLLELQLKVCGFCEGDGFTERAACLGAVQPWPAATLEYFSFPCLQAARWSISNSSMSRRPCKSTKIQSQRSSSPNPKSQCPMSFVQHHQPRL